MAAVLNITNGDSAVEIMRRAGVEGEYLPWRDVLHDGPVPGGIELAELSALRARFIADCGWGDYPDILSGFAQRDTCLAKAAERPGVILWFEHDLYDQLQILQLLDYFSHAPLENTPISMICTDRYLGMLSPAKMSSLRAHEQAVTSAQLELASQAWAAFRSDSPLAWRELLEQDTGALPFLRPAVLRLLQEYPDCVNGLSRTEYQALSLVDAGIQTPGRLFAANQALEEAMFMGDASFFLRLERLINAQVPLLQLNTGNRFSRSVDPKQRLSLTAAGRAVLSGERNRLSLAPLEDWIGGVHLTQETSWCWDEQDQALCRYSATTPLH